MGVHITTNMQHLLYAAVCLACVCLAAARPRFVLVPIEEYEAAQSQPAPVYIMPARQARQLPVEYEDQQPLYLEAASPQEPLYVGASNTHEKRQAPGGGGYGGDDYVDYGAYTGKQGAFGWYTDHPVGGGHR